MVLIKHTYGIEWELPDEETYDHIKPYKLDIARNIRERLLNLRNKDNDSDNLIGKIVDLLAKLKSDILKYLETIEGMRPVSFKHQDEFELNILVFDKELCRYQYVIKYCQSSIKNIENEDNIIHGNPVAGSAAKCKSPAWMFSSNSPISDKNIVKRQCDTPMGKYFYAIVAVPLFFPVDSDNLICIVKLASCSSNARLRYLDDRRDKCKEKKMKILQELFHGDFLKGLCKITTDCTDKGDSCFSCFYSKQSSPCEEHSA
ncbi:MAG: hypothetical protein HQL04_01970 [Nitrospirae bacterium]|nr:hypothetical protein [Nitrospirota bacterium]